MPTNRDVNLDVAKGILIILVILNHVSSQLIIERGINPPPFPSSLAISDYLWVFIRQSIYFAIPLFLFISGYVLTQAHMLETPLRSDRFYRRRLKRIYIPFLLWLSVYMVFFWDKIILYQVFMSLVFLEGNFHFWYLWVICIFYLAFPWLLLAVQKNAAMVVLGMGLLVVLALTLKDKPWTDSYTLNFIMQNKILILPENALYFLMGMLTAIRLEKNFRQYPSSKPLLILLILIGVGAFLGRWRHFFDRSFIGDPRGYYAINLTYAILSMYFFLLWVKALVIKTHSMTQHLALIGQGSYGIYLSHMAVMYALRDAGSHFWPASSDLYALAILIVCTGISYLLAKILSISRLRMVTGF